MRWLVLTVNAEGLRLEQRDFGGRVVRFTAVACLIVRYVRQDGELRRNGLVRRLDDGVDLKWRGNGYNDGSL